MNHVYLHKRKKDDANQGDNNNGGNNQFAGVENGINSLVAAASSFFNPAPAASISKKHQSQHLEIRQADDNSGGKGPSTVFVTAPWTGSGTDFSYSTVLPDATSVASKDPVPAQTTKSQDATSTTLRKTTQRTTTSSPSASDTITATAAATTMATAAISSGLSISSTTTDASAAAVTTAASTIATSSSDTGLSTGAKAGIAIAVILLFLAAAAGAFTLWRIKKNRDEEAHDIANSSEKNPFSDTADTTNSRPQPPIMASMMKPSTPTNPFGSGAVTVPPATSRFESDAITSVPGNTVIAAGAGLAAGAVVGAAAANARRASIPAPLNLNTRTQTPPLITRTQTPPLMPPPTIAPSPSGSNFSEASTFTTGAMAAIGDAGINTPGGPRMHRVQMDFNPTMEDELRITAGEIIRVDREFDDGWCSVEVIQRDDQGKLLRRQSGVVPRTCLSRLPLKPRSKRAGPPPVAIPQFNGIPGTNSGRLQSPSLVPNTVQRSMSPGPYGGGPQDRPKSQDTRSRSNSASDISGMRPKVAPLGPSPMNPASQSPMQTVQSLPRSSTMPDILPTPLVPGHARISSVGSSASAPVARKPVPGKTDA